MNVVIWIVQVLLAFAFAGAGFMKLTSPYEKVKERMAWAGDFSPNIVKAIGLIELLGAIGLIVPALTGILPELTPIAAVGLVITMIGAAFTHFRRNEIPMMMPSIVLGVLAAFVAYGRFVSVPL
ncbi:MAG: DoxX family protein [Chitinophagaceae bacterium]|nr:DoxX family protein [Anaerolineae bacterium]